MVKIIRTNSKNQDFIDLVGLLDADLAIKDGDEHSFYDQFNKIDQIKYVIILYEKDRLVGCGAIKEFDSQTTEIKRMYVSEGNRGKGFATTILTELEKWSSELYFKRCVLETGKKQIEAIGLYKKNNYYIIPNYGQYAGKENSICFEKQIDIL